MLTYAMAAVDKMKDRLYPLWSSLQSRLQAHRTAFITSLKEDVIASIQQKTTVQNHLQPTIHYATITIPRVYIMAGESKTLTFPLADLDRRCGVILMPCNQVGLTRIHHHHYITEKNELAVVFTNNSTWMESPGLAVGDWLVIIFKLPEEAVL